MHAHDNDPDGPEPRRQILQRGSGAYSLCVECNNLTGRLYVPELSAWVRSGANALFGEPGLAARYRDQRRTVYAGMTINGCQPGRFLKQVATMLLAMSPPELGDRFPGLRNYAREPSALGLPPELRFYLVLYAGPRGRYSAGIAQVSGFLTDVSEMHFVYELAAPPYAYILSVQETTPVIEAGNITSFATVGIDAIANVKLQLIIGYGETPFPLDFRSPAAHTAGVAVSEAAMGT
ncbi:MAG: hypothetical protein WB709_08650 [Solirubrobacteraceae bacterium]